MDLFSASAIILDMGVEQTEINMSSPKIPEPKTGEDIFINRISWNMTMVEMLRSRKAALLQELTGIEGQISSVLADTRQLVMDYSEKKLPFQVPKE